MKLEELELVNTLSEDPFSNTLKIVRFVNDDGSCPCNHGLAYSLCNTESACCYMCKVDGIINSVSKMNIESSGRNGIDFPIFWTVHKKEFRIDKINISDVDQGQITRFASFCARSNLEEFAFTKFQDFRLSLLIVTHENEDAGFAIYSSNIPEDDFDMRVVIDFLQQVGWVPQKEDSWDIWFTEIISWIDAIDKRGLRYEDPDDIPFDDISEVRESLRSVLFSTEMVLIDNLTDIAKWIYTYEPTAKKIDITHSVIKLDLVCADKDLAGYGILDHVLLTLQKEALNDAEIHELKEAYIKLTPVDKAHEARYRVAGFRAREDDEFFWTKNLVKIPLSFN